MMVVVVQAFFGLRAWSVCILLSLHLNDLPRINSWFGCVAYEEKLASWCCYLRLYAHSLWRWDWHQSHLHPGGVDAVRKRRQGSCVSLNSNVAQLLDLFIFCFYDIATSVSSALWRQI